VVRWAHPSPKLNGIFIGSTGLAGSAAHGSDPILYNGHAMPLLHKIVLPMGDLDAVYNVIH